MKAKARSDRDDKAAGDSGLSFVQNGRPRDWWAVKPSGGWADDCAEGELLAREYLLAARAGPDNASLGLGDPGDGSKR